MIEDRLPPAPVLDAHAFDRFGIMDSQLRAELLDLFCRMALSDLDALGTAAGNADVSEFQRLAHRTKGAAVSVGAREMARIAARLEREAPNLAGPEMARAQTQLARAFQRVAEHIHEQRAAPAPKRRSRA